MVEFERKALFLQKIQLTMNVVCYFFLIFATINKIK